MGSAQILLCLGSNSINFFSYFNQAGVSIKFYILQEVYDCQRKLGEINGQKFPVTSIRWEGRDQVEGSDVHILRNEVPLPPLTKILKVNREPSEKSSTAINLLEKEKLEFLGNFNQNSVSHGIKVDENTGSVTAELLGRNLNNFIIHVILTDSSIEPPKRNTFETRIRVHIHDTLTKEWLTNTTNSKAGH